MRKLLILLSLACLPLAAQERAKNVVLFLADAGGTSALHAASILGHGDTRKLYVQNMPHIGLSDTTSASSWVSDSAAGMTAIMTGERTNNGVVAQSDTAVRREKDGERLKTFLEYAEEHGLATGVVTDRNVTDATPASCYAHSNDRSASSHIFQQLFKPGYGDGVDVLIGGGKSSISAALEKDGIDMKKLVKKSGWKMFDSVSAMPSKGQHMMAVFDSADDFDLAEAVAKATEILSKNPKGYFLMVEGDVHTNDVEKGLTRMVKLDKIVADTAKRVGDDTLVMFTADHSFDFRMARGGRETSLIEPQADNGDGYSEDRRSFRGKQVRMDNAHTGEEVLVSAEGPGADAVHGYMANTDLFGVMMDAMGWSR